MTQTDVRHEQAVPRGADTRERIIDAAERLFADQGVQNTSLRQITKEAGVNLAAINYHFQSKEQLVTAIMRRLLDPINERRFQILDALEGAAQGEPVELEALLRAFLLPIFEIRDNHPRTLNIPKLYGRLHSEPGELISKFFMPIVAPVVARFMPAFMRALPGLPQRELAWSIHFVMGATINSLAAPQTLAVLTRGESEMEGWPELLERLIAFCAGGLRAAAQRSAMRGGR